MFSNPPELPNPPKFPNPNRQNFRNIRQRFIPKLKSPSVLIFPKINECYSVNKSTTCKIISQEGIYTGSVSNTEDQNVKLRQGRGTMNYKNGNIYIGEWSDDKKHGKGLFIDNSDKTIYYGIFLEGFQDGIGILVSEDQSIFIGTWKENTQQAEALLTVDTNINITSNALDNSNPLCSPNDNKIQIVKNVHGNKGIILDTDEKTIYFGKMVNCKKDDVDGWEYNYFTSILFVGKWNEGLKTDYGIECYYDKKNKIYEAIESVEPKKRAKKILKHEMINNSSVPLTNEQIDGGKPKRKTRKQRKSKTRKNYRNRKNMKTRNNY